MTPAGSDLPDPLAQPATPHRLRIAMATAGFTEQAIARAEELALRTPDETAWGRFLSFTLALLGSALLLAGAICAVAYNWTRIGRFGKFALIEAAIVVAALLGWRLLPRLSGRLALFAAAVLVGPLLAVYGQTYQTGADPYGLFLTWAALIIPWVIAARFSLLWLLLIALFDLTMMLWWSQVVGTEDLPALPLAIAALHGIALIVWEWQYAHRNRWLDERWAAHVVAAGGFAALTIGASVFIVEDRDAGLAGAASLVLLAGAIVAVFHHYRRVRLDALMVTLGAVAGLVVIAVFVGRIIFDWLDLGFTGSLLMAVFVIAEITLGLRWFRASRVTAEASSA